jgi:S1-C subfamily serine protease
MTASQRIRRAVLPTAAAAVSIGFGIPANMARGIAGQLIESGQVTSGG